MTGYFCGLRVLDEAEQMFLAEAGVYHALEMLGVGRSEPQGWRMLAPRPSIHFQMRSRESGLRQPPYGASMTTNLELWQKTGRGLQAMKHARRCRNAELIRRGHLRHENVPTLVQLPTRGMKLVISEEIENNNYLYFKLNLSMQLLNEKEHNMLQRK